jgi:hypothetical protein
MRQTGGYVAPFAMLLGVEQLRSLYGEVGGPPNYGVV